MRHSTSFSSLWNKGTFNHGLDADCTPSSFLAKTKDSFLLAVVFLDVIYILLNVYHCCYLDDLPVLTGHLRFACIIIAQWKQLTCPAVRALINCLGGNSVIRVVVRWRKWEIAAVNTVWTPSTTLPSLVLWPAYWSLFLTWRTSCPSPSLVRAVTLWWCGEDEVKSSLLSFPFSSFASLVFYMSISSLSVLRLSFLSLPLVSALQCTFLSSIKQEMFISAVDL